MKSLSYVKIVCFLCILLPFYGQAQVGIGTTTPNYDLDVAGVANLNKDIAQGVALRVNGVEALWYNGTFYSWGYGADFNYFADRIGIGTTNPNAAYSLDATQGINVLNGVGTGNLLSTNGNISITFDTAAQRYIWGSGGARNHFPDAVGIGPGTVNASQTLDVGGNARIRNLTEGSVVANQDGVLETSLYTKSVRSQPNDQWSRVLTGTKSTVLTFSGRTASPGGPDFAFVVHYDVNDKRFTPMTAANCTVADEGGTAGDNGRLLVTVNGFIYRYTVTAIAGTIYSNITSVRVDNAGNPLGGYWSQGTFSSSAF